jgi:hypothetical protein
MLIEYVDEGVVIPHRGINLPVIRATTPLITPQRDLLHVNFPVVAPFLQGLHLFVTINIRI